MFPAVSEGTTAGSSDPESPWRPAEAAGAPAGSRMPSRIALIALLVGLIVTAVLAIICVQLYDQNETRLLRLRARELALVLTATVPSTQTPLASAAELAEATAGSVPKFRAFVSPYVGPGKQFESVSLWRVGPSGTTLTSAVVGPAPLLASLPSQARSFFERGRHTDLLNVTGILGAARPSLGFSYKALGASPRFVVYAEKQLPKNRRSTVESNSAFSDLNYALYLGHRQSSSSLLVTSLSHLPASGRRAADVEPFGDSALTLVVTPRVSLGGAFFQHLPWIVAVAGLLISLAAALLTDRLVQRRRRAEALARILDRVAGENQRMYAEQRSIAETLQHALLPSALPKIEGLTISASYIPASAGIDVGGDWYDVVAIAEGRVLLVIGDVSGHGLIAATTMASLRHATLAYAAEDADPVSVLTKLSDYVNQGPHDYFATMLCAIVDLGDASLTIASAGHPPPLLMTGGRGRYLDVSPGVPIGVRRTAPYASSRLTVAPNSTLVAFTDGLVERRGEVIDAGLDRLRIIADRQTLPVEDLGGRLASDLATDEHHDDTAILIVRWQD